MTFKKTLLPALACAALALTAACNNSTTSGSSATTDTTTNTMQSAKGGMEQTATNASTSVSEAMDHNPDSSFVATVALANNEEINELQAGIDKGGSKDLKAHAKMMIKDHKGLKAKLEAYAAKKNYPIPMDDQGKAATALNDMSSKTGADWDKAWASAMYDGHEKTIGVFEGAQSHVKDDELKGMITATLPTLHAHLEMVKELQAKLEK